ncbi:MAG: hypothetical protein U9R31_01935 [Candidatus Omnitrophota bacterium]|nr:hypothetical protein [Candidatus Omnitrophota bacterium]
MTANKLAAISVWEIKMGKRLILIIFILVSTLAAAGVVYPETIYTRDGQEIQARITEKTADTVWYELTSGDMIEYIGIDIADIDKILSDEGNVSEYSPIIGAQPQ